MPTLSEQHLHKVGTTVRYSTPAAQHASWEPDRHLAAKAYATAHPINVHNEVSSPEELKLADFQFVNSPFNGSDSRPAMSKHDAAGRLPLGQVLMCLVTQLQACGTACAMGCDEYLAHLQSEAEVS